MRAFEILTEAEAVPATKKVGREFNHLEDLVFIDPENGAVRAVEILRSMEQGAKDVAVKWDGYPTMYWGRDSDGTFFNASVTVCVMLSISFKGISPKNFNVK